MKITDNSLYWAKVREDAIIPTKEVGNAGYDIYANFENLGMRISIGETKVIPTGIACAVSDDYYLQVEERGSTGSKGIKKSAGVIDSNYRGEIFIAITNCSNKDIIIAKENCSFLSKLEDFIFYPYEKAIAQLVVQQVPKMKCKEVSFEELKQFDSNRGDGALGSSGK